MKWSGENFKWKTISTDLFCDERNLSNEFFSRNYKKIIQSEETKNYLLSMRNNIAGSRPAKIHDNVASRDVVRCIDQFLRESKTKIIRTIQCLFTGKGLSEDKDYRHEYLLNLHGKTGS